MIDASGATESVSLQECYRWIFVRRVEGLATCCAQKLLMRSLNSCHLSLWESLCGQWPFLLSESSYTDSVVQESFLLSYQSAETYMSWVIYPYCLNKYRLFVLIIGFYSLCNNSSFDGFSDSSHWLLFVKFEPSLDYFLSCKALNCNACWISWMLNRQSHKLRQMEQRGMGTGLQTQINGCSVTDVELGESSPLKAGPQ